MHIRTLIKTLIFSLALSAGVASSANAETWERPLHTSPFTIWDGQVTVSYDNSKTMGMYDYHDVAAPSYGILIETPFEATPDESPYYAISDGAGEISSSLDFDFTVTPAAGFQLTDVKLERHVNSYFDDMNDQVTPSTGSASLIGTAYLDGAEVPFNLVSDFDGVEGVRLSQLFPGSFNSVRFAGEISITANASEGNYAEVWVSDGVDPTVLVTTAVPEPTAIAVLALGGVALLRRRH